MRSTSASPRVVVVLVGSAQRLGTPGAEAWYDEPWRTGIFKQRATHAVHATVNGLLGDEQADLDNHGGPDKAICAYSADHYPDWQRTLGLPTFTSGAFGENLTVEGLAEEDVCIGDRWQLGDVVLQVSQPRQPCWKLARKWRIKDLADRVVDSGRTGWYFRVRHEGEIAHGMALVLVDRPHPAWTVAAANEVMHRRRGDTAELASLEALSGSWRRTLFSRLSRAGGPDPER